MHIDKFLSVVSVIWVYILLVSLLVQWDVLISKTKIMQSSIRCQNVWKTGNSGSEPSVRSTGNQQNTQHGVVHSVTG